MTKATLSLDAQLCERNLGDLLGRPYAEVREQVWREGFDPPRREPWGMFNHRIDAVWRWVEQFGQKIEGALALVTHGLVCRVLARRHLTLGGHAHPLRFPNASVTVITAAPPCRVEVLASDTHLHARE